VPKPYGPPWPVTGIALPLFIVILILTTNPRHRLLHEKLIVPRLVKKFPAFYEAQKSIALSVIIKYVNVKVISIFS
jgi:hypothetical protein